MMMEYQTLVRLFLALISLQYSLFSSKCHYCIVDAQHQQPEPEYACVTLVQYKHRNSCGGTPVSIRNNTVWTAPGMPCKHTDRMGSNSVTDEFCSNLDDNTDRPEFHQTVYVKNKHCKVEWYQKAYSPMKLTYTADSCTYGYKITTCTRGACENPSPPALLLSEEEEIGMMHSDS